MDLISEDTEDDTFLEVPTFSALINSDSMTCTTDEDEEEQGAPSSSIPLVNGHGLTSDQELAVNNNQEELTDVETETNGKEDEEEYESRKEEAKRTVIKIPGLCTLDCLKELCEAEGVKPILTYVKKKDTRSQFGTIKRVLPEPITSQKTVKKSRVNYEVESIIDYNEETERYLVKWEDWEDKYNTWEPLGHLEEGCADLLAEFESKKNVELPKRDKMYRELIDFKLTIAKIIAPNYTDMAIFLKLFDIQLASLKPSKNALVRLKKELKTRCEALEELNREDFSSMQLAPIRLHREISKELKLDSLFGSMRDFLNFYDERKDVNKRLQKWQQEISSIETEAGQAELLVENLVDTVGPPPDFQYITECKPYSTDIVMSSEPVEWCECTNCFEQKTECCPKHHEAQFKYNADGVLRDTRSALIVECNSKCSCPDTCPNRVIQKGRKFKLCIFRTDTGLGWGVKTLEKIPKGSFVMEYVGEIVPVDIADARGYEYDLEGRTYLFDLDHNENLECLFVVDAAKMGNVSHFVNHSCNPNLEVYVASIENQNLQMPQIVLFSKRTIRAGEELTFDYRMSRPAHYPGLSLSEDHKSSDEIKNEDDEKDEEQEEAKVKKSENRQLENEDDEATETEGEAEDDHNSGHEKRKGARETDIGFEQLKTIQCKCGATNCRKFLF